MYLFTNGFDGGWPSIFYEFGLKFFLKLFSIQ
jgi:hypothetical protein